MTTRSKLAATSLVLAMACGGALAEPLADLDALAARCKAAFDGRPMTQVTYAEAANTWVKRQFLPAEVLVRGRKTNSPITPYVAQIMVTEIAAAQRGDNEELARAMDVPPEQNVMRSVHTIHLAFQDNAWTLMGGTSVVAVKRDAGDDFSAASSARWSREASKQIRGPLGMCLNDPAGMDQTALRVVP